MNYENKFIQIKYKYNFVSSECGARARQQTRVMHKKHGISSLRVSASSNGWAYLLPSQRTCCSLNYQTLVYPAYYLQSAPKNKQEKNTFKFNCSASQRCILNHTLHNMYIKGIHFIIFYKILIHYRTTRYKFLMYIWFCTRPQENYLITTRHRFHTLSYKRFIILQLN